MDFDTASAPDFGRSLSGLGLNLLVRDVPRSAAFLCDVFGMIAHQASRDFAILRYGAQVFQLHSDPAFANHPLAALLPEAGPRGAGIELRLYETDPDGAVAAASAQGHEATILQEPTNKPHGLREAVILCENGYAWVPSRPLTPEEEAALG